VPPLKVPIQFNKWAVAIVAFVLCLPLNAESTSPMIILRNFNEPSREAPWYAQNDDVMGGVSILPVCSLWKTMVALPRYIPLWSNPIYQNTPAFTSVQQIALLLADGNPGGFSLVVDSIGAGPGRAE
jgi:hypothetical protein